QLLGRGHGLSLDLLLLGRDGNATPAECQECQHPEREDRQAATHRNLACDGRDRSLTVKGRRAEETTATAFRDLLVLRSSPAVRKSRFLFERGPAKGRRPGIPTWYSPSANVPLPRS